MEYFSFWRDNNIDDNFWNSTEATQIMYILKEYIFSDLEINKLYQLLMISNSEIKYLNSVNLYYSLFYLLFIILFIFKFCNLILC